MPLEDMTNQEIEYQQLGYRLETLAREQEEMNRNTIEIQSRLANEFEQRMIREIERGGQENL